MKIDDRMIMCVSKSESRREATKMYSSEMVGKSRLFVFIEEFCEVMT